MHGYQSWVEDKDWDTITEAERRVVRRVEASYWALCKNATWDEAIAAALVAEPFDPEDPSERDVGAVRK